ncbi:interferon-induced GTP-binding protein Mx [Bipolaris maydis]|nr:interferon-induced GTP-binding protein Mx [Bipolaris maydis]
MAVITKSGKQDGSLCPGRVLSRMIYQSELEPSEDPHASWSASVSLRRNFSYENRPAEVKDVGVGASCRSLTRTVRNYGQPGRAGAYHLRRATRNHQSSVDYQEFLNSSLHLGENHSQPGLSALSFYDLPGIIGQAETEDKKFLVKFVRDLVKNTFAIVKLLSSYAALLRPILPLSAGGIARDLGATDRCIGVLTKPDRLPAGSRHDKIREIFDRKRFALGYGYFVVKNPGQDEINRGISHREARIQEESFFREDTTWRDAFKSATNPQRISDYVGHYLNFSQEVRREIKAEFPHKEWRNNWKALQKTFFSNLESMKPGMKLRGVDDESVYLDVQAALPGASAKVPIALSDEEDNGENSTDSDASGKSPKKKRRLTQWRQLTSQNAELHLKKTFELDTVREFLAENSQSKVPGQIEPRVIDTMMLTAIQHWDEPLHHFLRSLQEQVHKQMQALFDKHFESRKGSMFYDKAWEILQKLICPVTTWRAIAQRRKPGPTRLALYKRQKEQRTKKPFTPAEEERVKKTSMPILAHEPYAREIGVIAQVTTYYMLAARRFHDAVCMRIESKFHKELCYQDAIHLLAEPTDRYKQRMDLQAQRKALVKGQEILRDLQHRYGGNKGGSGGSGVCAS